MSAARRGRAAEPLTGFRCEVEPGDVEAVRAIVTSTGFFHAEEIEVAVELVEERLARGAASGYHFLFPRAGSEADPPAGYACFGPVPATRGSFDLYWIAVHAARRRRGLGRRLLAAAEQAIALQGGRRVWVETSSRELYAPTRAFYRSCGYEEAARLEDFYAPGDSKVVFVKRLAP